ncbi:unnamed protein product [Lactuca saligna]|uniref:Uncharacterized protein n=1 Tax=Lactuca saligna TaxID=75948 RepID=A0AA35Y6J9_LACSI|nr:unnamed protein product [Lactuca saligna]
MGKSFSTRNPTREKPCHIEQQVWNSWNAIWNLEEIKKKSEQNKKKNRRKDVLGGKAPPTHNGGSTSHQQIAADMEEYTGQAPSCYDVFMFTHTKDHDGKTFQVDKAKEVHDLFVSRRADLALLGEELMKVNYFIQLSEDMTVREEFMSLDHMAGPFCLKFLLKHALHRIQLLKNIILRP